MILRPQLTTMLTIFFQCWQWNRPGHGHKIQSQHYLPGQRPKECLL